jgi:Fe-S cluster assembly scaffold protein SufB
MKIIKLTLEKDIKMDVKEDSCFIILPSKKGENKTKKPKNISLKLATKGVRAKLIYANILKEREEEIKIFINHIAADTHSLVIFRAVLEDKSGLRFYGNIDAASKANNCSGLLDIKALSAGKDIAWEAKPNLGVQNNSVDIRHKASLVNYSQEQVFYLKNRGLDEEEAKSALKSAFLQEAFTTMENNEEINYLIKESLI